MNDRQPTVGSFALVCSRFNELIVDRLEHGARRALVSRGVADEAISTFWAPSVR